jgi:CHAT domain-containing protein
VLAQAWTDGGDAARVDQRRRDLDASRARLVRAENDLRAARPGALTTLRSVMTEPPSLASVQANLPDGAVLVEYLYGGDAVQIVAVARRGAVSRRIDAATGDVRALLGRLQRSCRPDTIVPAGGASYDELAGRAAELFVDPIADVLRDHQRLVLVPYGALHGTPLHALRLDGDVLGERCVVSYLPAAASLTSELDRPIDSGGRLVIGDPARMTLPDGRAAPSLDHAALEARYIAAISGATALVAEQASEESVRAQLASARVLHAATHGLVDAVAPMRSAILLADGQQLTVSELIGLRLQAELVVLSACDTGGGDITSGDDVLGLSRGVLAAGAHRVVVSLWPVVDDLACVVMARFHELLVADQPPAIALGQAQQELRVLTRSAITERLDALAARVGTAATVTEPSLRLVGGARPTAALDHPSTWAAFVYVGL